MEKLRWLRRLQSVFFMRDLDEYLLYLSRLKKYVVGFVECLRKGVIVWFLKRCAIGRKRRGILGFLHVLRLR
jgi:hypothetical protein